MIRIFAIFCIFVFTFNTSLVALPKGLISNWQHPTSKDLEAIQHYLDHKSINKNEYKYGDRQQHIRAFKLYQPGQEYPSLKIESFGENERRHCIICYSSLNKRFESSYATNFKRLRQSLRNSGYSGDLMYRIGGWPNMEAGGLILCDVPYSFKICAFQEAKRLGYEQVLWLDVSVIVLKNLEKVFAHIHKYGAYFRKSKFQFTNGTIINEDIAKSLNTTTLKLRRMHHYASGILGLDLSIPRVQHLLQDWHRLAIDKRSFCSPFPEQVPLSFLIHKYNLRKGLCPTNSIVFNTNEIVHNTSFLINYQK